MLRTKHYECPDCGQAFGYTTHLTDDPPPNFCPLCGNSMLEPPAETFVPQAPYVSDKTIGRTGDRVYRQMEQASVDHTHLMAEMTGAPASDFSSSKITDLADHLRPGDIAAKIASNPVSSHMAQHNQGGFRPVMGMDGRTMAQGTRSGPYPGAGSDQMLRTVREHPMRQHLVQRMGQIAKS